ncbi:hypothetical protein GCM10010151_64870 [Actinoallomurus spadix]|uniref:Uncharacterized protein n=1 Tax=Actinoallomurus spadix TaxID=79912 RepID=A0ABN0XJW7_9ACTN
MVALTATTGEYGAGGGGVGQAVTARFDQRRDRRPARRAVRGIDVAEQRDGHQRRTAATDARTGARVHGEGRRRAYEPGHADGLDAHAAHAPSPAPAAPPYCPRNHVILTCDSEDRPPWLRPIAVSSHRLLGLVQRVT